MNSKKFLPYALLAGMFLPLTANAEPPLIPEDIKNEIRKRVDNLYSTAMAVGVMDANGATYFSYGKLDLDRGGPVNEDTLFEVPGLVNTFTATVLADMAQRGELSLTNLIEDYLPDGLTLSVYGPAQTGITFDHLASHMSGLPYLPSNIPNLKSVDYGTPGYTLDQFYDFLTSFTLTRAPGAKFELSNCGTALLGYILAHTEGQTLDTLLRQRITDVLGLRDTVFQMTPAQESRAVAPYRGAVRFPNADWGALAPAGQVRSTPRDVLTYLAANLGLLETPLYAAMTNAHSARYASDRGTRVGLIWETRTVGSASAVELNAGAGAYRVYAGFMPDHKRAVVVLATGLDTTHDIGPCLLSPEFPKFTSYPVPAQASTRFLRECAGTYTLPGHVIQIGLEHGHLTFVWSGDDRTFTLYPTKSAKNNRFLLPPPYSNATIGTSSVTFNLNAQGEVISLTWVAFAGTPTVPKQADLPLPPELVLNRSASGSTLELLGNADSSYIVECSSDLLHWSQLTIDARSGTLIPFSCTEQNRFYRAKEQ